MMQCNRCWKPALAVAGALLMLSACATMSSLSGRSSGPILGHVLEIGGGEVSSYAEVDGGGVPTAIGVVFSGAALESLPNGSDQHRCFDRDGDGTINSNHECIVTNEFVLPLPDIVARRADIPFKWVLLNWNPAGHIPPRIYDVPHFDIHFYMEPIAKVFSLIPGPCGPESIRCDQFEIARIPVPANYMHPDYKDVEAVVPAMGNHLIDVSGPEFHGEPFTRSWIFGIYDGRVTFYEEMVALAHLLDKPQRCHEIKSPPAVGRSGYYPTMSCIRHDEASGEYRVSMEGFRMREASDPVPAG